MKLTIQVTDDEKNSLSPSIGQGSETSAETSASASDGGAPPASLTGNSPTASAAASLVDIGGPPQWLVDGLAKNQGNGEQTTGAPSSGDALGTDAGGAPSFG